MTSFTPLSNSDEQERERAIAYAAIHAGALSYLTEIARELGIGLSPDLDELLERICLGIRLLQSDQAYLDYLTESDPNTLEDDYNTEPVDQQGACIHP